MARGVALRALKRRLTGWCEREIRKRVAEEIAVAIERLYALRGAHYHDDPCVVCARHEQVQADAAIARRHGGAG